MNYEKEKMGLFITSTLQINKLKPEEFNNFSNIIWPVGDKTRI